MGDFLYTPLLSGDKGEIEHLYSYVARSANIHHLSQYQFLWLLDDWWSKQAGEERTIFRRAYQSRTGLCAYGDDVAEILSALSTATGESQLERATFSALRSALSRRPQGLLKRSRAWCPACFSEARRCGDAVFDRLYWIAAYCTRCIFHKLRLMDVCPSCRSPQVGYSSRKGLEYCYKCTKLLIGKTDQWVREVNPGYGERQTIELIEYISENPNAVFNEHSIGAFHREMYQLTLGQYAKWRNPYIRKHSQDKYIFQTVLEDAVNHDLSLLLMFQDPILAARVAVDSKWPMAKRIRRRKPHVRAVRAQLESMLKGAAHCQSPLTGHISLQGICEPLGVSTGYAYYHFPELCRTLRVTNLRIVRETRAAVEQHMSIQLANGLYANYSSGAIKRQKQVIVVLASTCGGTINDARRSFRKYHQKMIEGSGQSRRGSTQRVLGPKSSLASG